MIVINPPFIIFENVQLFPVQMLRDMLGAIYDVDDILANPASVGWPIRRVRRYVVMKAKHVTCTWTPLEALFAKLEGQLTTPGRVLYVEEVPPGSALRHGYARRLEGYINSKEAFESTNGQQTIDKMRCCEAH